MTGSSKNLFAAQIDEKLVSPGLLGFLVVAAIGVALYFLVKSMNRQIGKIDLGDDSEPTAKAAAEPVRDEAPGEKK